MPVLSALRKARTGTSHGGRSIPLNFAGILIFFFLLKTRPHCVFLAILTYCLDQVNLELIELWSVSSFEVLGLKTCASRLSCSSSCVFKMEHNIDLQMWQRELWMLVVMLAVGISTLAGLLATFEQFSWICSDTLEEGCGEEMLGEVLKEDLSRWSGCLSLDLMNANPEDELLRQKEPETQKCRTFENIWGTEKDNVPGSEI